MLCFPSCSDMAAKAQRNITSGSDERPEVSSAARQQAKKSGTITTGKIDVFQSFMLFFPKTG